MTQSKPLIVLVSSTVYGNEGLLEGIYTQMTGFGYEVWMSHKGTVPVIPGRSNFENCLSAVEQCDIFLGIITTSYGTGRDGGGLSITHEELLKAIEIKKPRWVLVHDHVVFARTLLTKLGHDSSEKRAALTLTPSPVIDDLRVVDMYEAAILHDIPLRDRKGNWVQRYVTREDALLFAHAQFHRYHEVAEFLSSNFSDREAVLEALSGGKVR